MVLNALAIDPGRKWKGPWRWFDETMLDCCEPLEKVKSRGITFGKLACLAQCAGAKVEAFHSDHSSIENFRRYVVRSSTSDDCHVISSYNRAAFKQTGSGHFSPIGGYHEGKDMALILDVARFKYPPHWVPLNLLWKGMNEVDGTTGKYRGFMLISRPNMEPGLLYTLSCKHESWPAIAKYLMDDVPLLLNSENVKHVQQVLSVVFTSLPSNFDEFIKWVAEVRRPEEGSQTLSPEEKARLSVKEEVLKQAQDTDLYKHVTAYLSSESTRCKHSIIPSGDGESLPNIAASVCCQGAEILSGNSTSHSHYCCNETCVRCFKANGGRPITVVSGTVINGSTEQGVDMLVPGFRTQSTCSCSNLRKSHPAGDDVLTALLLALPPQTWSGIKDETLMQEIHSLVRLRIFRLCFKKRCCTYARLQENKVDDNLASPQIRN